MAFTTKALDFKLSPYTGLTRKSWIEAGEYLLRGVFENIKGYDEPIVVPREETEITYPHLKASEDVQKIERTAAMFEGLTRTLFIAAPLIHENPDFV